MNRWELESVRAGIAQSLKQATDELSALYSDASSKLEDRQTKKAEVQDLKERLSGISQQIEAEDAAAAKRMQKSADPAEEKDVRIKAKAMLYRAAMRGEIPSQEHYKALNAEPSAGGDKFLPKTVAEQILADPATKNPLRNISTITNITNLEIPRIAFSLGDDAFVAEGATAKEIAATGATVTFGRNKFKVFVDVSETVLLGTDTNLVQMVDSGLESGLAKKEKTVAFSDEASEPIKHMSFYAKTGENYEIKETKCAEGTSLYKAILTAIADLEEDYRENATVVMRYADYLSILENLANGSATLYGVQPEQVLGKPVVFCDLAKIPVVGDFSYSHYNYDVGMQYERDKNVKTGMESFVLTAWFDHQIKLKSAFRLATIQGSH